ncbi:MAG: type II toxin-antitoxin system ParD family antitoxin [Candidatus Thiothrix sulfatifontis]|nr:MAG: type II toxin-antitoxin system ParD family antitoxin [Candidatus Thiothrix sulfatifontis]
MSQNTPISPIDHFEGQELRVQRLRESLIAGENSGQPQSFDREAFERKILHKSMDSERHLQDN